LHGSRVREEERLFMPLLPVQILARRTVCVAIETLAYFIGRARREKGSVGRWSAPEEYATRLFARIMR
jgi:hypothetical protein